MSGRSKKSKQCLKIVNISDFTWIFLLTPTTELCSCCNNSASVLLYFHQVYLEYDPLGHVWLDGGDVIWNSTVAARRTSFHKLVLQNGCQTLIIFVCTGCHSYKYIELMKRSSENHNGDQSSVLPIFRNFIMGFLFKDIKAYFRSRLSCLLIMLTMMHFVHVLPCCFPYTSNNSESAEFTTSVTS